jgi:hypothetical protein
MVATKSPYPSVRGVKTNPNNVARQPKKKIVFKSLEVFTLNTPNAVVTGKKLLAKM